MVRTLRQTGSDFAVGSIRRQVRGRYVERHWLRKLHAEPQPAITIDDAPAMLGNIWAVTKVFRRDFLAAHRPARSRSACATRTRCRSPAPTSRRAASTCSPTRSTSGAPGSRARRSPSRSTRPNDLRDRLAAKQQVADLLDQGASELVVGQWFTKVFRLDLMPYFRAALTADESYWTVLTTATAWLVEHAPAATWDSLELRFRVAARLAARRDRDALTRLFAVHQLDTSNFESVLRDGHLVADVDLGLPPGPATDEMLRLTAVDLPSSAQLDDVTWSDDGQRHAARRRLRAAPAARALRREHHPARPAALLVGRRPGRRTSGAGGERRGQPVRPAGLRGPPGLGLRRHDRRTPPGARLGPDPADDLAGVGGRRRRRGAGRGWFAHRNDVGTVPRRARTGGRRTRSSWTPGTAARAGR